MRMRGVTVAGLALAATAACGAAPGGGTATVTTAGVRAPACPARAPGRAGLGGPGASADVLVPGAPAVATVCRYADMNARHPGALRSARVLRGAAPGAVRSGLDRQPPVTGAYSCPMDTGGAHLLMFGYRDGSVVRVRVADSGCRFAGNGHRVVRVPAGVANRLAH